MSTCCNGKPNFGLATKARLSPGGWLISDLEMKYSTAAVDLALQHKNISVLNWWIDGYLISALILKYSILYSNDINIRNWIENMRKLLVDST